eukprot:6864849-Alexandrium_andersonii.AAC.1
MWPDTYAALDLEAQPQGYRRWKSKARGYLMGSFPRWAACWTRLRSSSSPSVGLGSTKLRAS